MTVFITGAVIMVIAALIFLLPPLLRQPRSDTEAATVLELYQGQLHELDADLAAGRLEPHAHAAAKRELAARMAADEQNQSNRVVGGGPGKLAALLLLPAVPLLAATVYEVNGNRAALDPAVAQVAAVDPKIAAHQDARMDELVAELQQRAAANPADREAWFMLGRGYRAMGKHDKSVEALQRAYALGDPNDTELMLEIAEGISMSNDGSLAGMPSLLIGQVLEKQPENPKALWYGGVAAMEAGNKPLAIERWQKLRGMNPPERVAQVLDEQLARARGELGVAAAEPESAPAPAASGDGLHVSVSLAPALADKLQPGRSLFIYAVQPGGPPMPLAVARLAARDLPTTVTLTDAMAMMPARKLSDFDSWKVIARISVDGDARAGSGDLFGEGQASKANPQLTLVIDQVQP